VAEDETEAREALLAERARWAAKPDRRLGLPITMIALGSAVTLIGAVLVSLPVSDLCEPPDDDPTDTSCSRSHLLAPGLAVLIPGALLLATGAALTGVARTQRRAKANALEHIDMQLDALQARLVVRPNELRIAAGLRF
jgi:hypothetical protein